LIETTVKDLREQLCKVGKRLFDAGLVTGTSGNVSARIPNTDRVLIKPSGTCLQTLRLEDFIMIDLQGRKLKGQGAVSLEGPMHAAVYRVRSDVNGIVHSHAPTATAFGIVGLKIIPMTVESFKFIPKGVPMVPFRRPGTKELAEAVQKKIIGFDALILENHGILTVGTSVEQACNLNIEVEEAANLQFKVSMLSDKEDFTKLYHLTKRFCSKS
jgi:L-ribulose-5-phosphate 4-epimerase